MNNEATDTQPKNENVLTEYLEGYQQLELESAENNLRKVRNTLFVVAGLTLLSGFLLYATNRALQEDLIVNCIIAGIYVALAFLTKKIPLAAVIIALALFVGIWIFNIVVGGTEYIFQGILVKAIILYYLIKGIGYAKEAEELRKKINKG